MTQQEIVDKIAQLEKEWRDLQMQAEQALHYLRGKIDVYREMLAEMEEEESEKAD